MIRKALFKNAKDRQAYMEHVMQENLRPGRNRHYQSGRCRDNGIYMNVRFTFLTQPNMLSAMRNYLFKTPYLIKP